jgi:replication-associated recombination protein RarA
MFDINLDPLIDEIKKFNQSQQQMISLLEKHNQLLEKLLQK